MLPQFVYVMGQAGADSRPPPSQPLYTTSTMSAATINATHPITTKTPLAPAAMNNNNITTNASLQHPYPSQYYPPHIMTAPPPLPPHQPHLYSSYLPPTAISSRGPPPWFYTTSASMNGTTTTTTEYHTQYYSSNYNKNYNTNPTTTTTSTASKKESKLPPPPFPAAPSSPKLPATTSSGSSVCQPLPSPPTYRSHVKPSLPTSRWRQEDPHELNDTKMIRRLRDCSDVMTWMDHDFRDQHDEIYHEKHQALQSELKSIQDGDHAVFQEQLADLEVIRNRAIANALFFETYQQTKAKQDFERHVLLIEEECKDEKRHLDEMIMLVMDDYRKQIKDDRGCDVELAELFTQVVDRLQQRKQSRKRTTTATSAAATTSMTTAAMLNGTTPVGGGGHLVTSRHEVSSRGRRLKNTTVTPHNINGPMNVEEEEDVEAEYLAMKGSVSKRQTTFSRRS